MKVSVSGGAAVTIAENGMKGLAERVWGPDESIVLSSRIRDGVFHESSAHGGEVAGARLPRRVSASRKHTYFPEILPGGEGGSLHGVAGRTSSRSTTHTIAALSLETGEQHGSLLKEAPTLDTARLAIWCMPTAELFWPFPSI